MLDEDCLSGYVQTFIPHCKTKHTNGWRSKVVSAYVNHRMCPDAKGAPSSYGLAKMRELDGAGVPA